MKTLAIYLVPIALFLSQACTPLQREGSPATVLSLQEGWAKTVYLTQDAQGVPVLAWTESESRDGAPALYFSRWDPAGGVFGQRVRVPANPSLVAHAEGMPKIVFPATGGIYAVYAARTESRGNPYAGRIEYLVSHDGGVSWTEPLMVHRDSTQEAGHDFFDAIALRDGRVAVSWLDRSHGEGGRPVHFATTDSSGGFAYETVVDDYACECCRTALYERDGRIVLLYRNIAQTASGTVRDIHYSLSDDGGESFHEGRVYSNDQWRIDGCPHNGPDVIMDSTSLFATWFTAGENRGLYYGELDFSSGRLERTLLDPDGHFAQLALLADGKRVAVYNAHRPADDGMEQPVFARVFPKGAAIAVSAVDDVTDCPVVVGLADGTAIVAWISRADTFSRLKYRHMDLLER